ncbi:hypothetical protein DACRYDRAFT_110180 [Dacryopinax primogenitus]|uniref:Nitrogen permease regulator 3 n=1 Tax=Dacryopinax primogenitus (strain DJM 731) TaxID=1858805 RepID=M5FV41_DACPD|nr:uncharacterized protein DACRYDRAFT_110180 [Dacryopinax primogenitus]EJT99459.1 hypothetical protein DACRYDRAFT_110180 [Dacryopinax primogenitus]
MSSPAVATPLIALLLVTTSSTLGTSIIFRYPPYPSSSARLMRPLPYRQGARHGLDGMYQASHLPSDEEEEEAEEEQVREMEASGRWVEEQVEYLFPRPIWESRPTTPLSTRSSSRPPPSPKLGTKLKKDYDTVLSFSSATLAEILEPARELCYQKFELVVDDLAFVGHPVCVARDGVWRMDNIAPPSSPRNEPTEKRERISFFHLVLVLDRPDPASYHSADLSSFLAPYHAQVAFKLTAGLVHEEVRAEYVSKHCARLAEMQERVRGKGGWYDQFCDEATGEAGDELARVMREVFEAVSRDGSARVRINHIVVDVQLPPADDEDEEDESENLDLEKTVYGWVPRLRPWSALLMLEEVDELPEEVEDQEFRQRFFDTLEPTLSLSDMSNLLDLDLWADVYPLARALIYTRKAKLVDVVRENLKSVYYPTSSVEPCPADHFHDFSRAFPTLPHLATILSSLSLSPVPFSSIVPASKDRPLYLEALIWLLKRNLLQMMHVRVRLIAPQELKESFALHRARKLSMTMTEPTSSSYSPETPFLANGLLSPMLLQRTRLPVHQPGSEEDSSSDQEQEEELVPGVIVDPGRASKIERRWLDEMNRGKEQRVVDLFERLLPYFDGKTTVDEILYRTEVGRRDLREVLHLYDPYVSLEPGTELSNNPI